MSDFSTVTEPIQNWKCKECDNDMDVRMFSRSPYKGIILECTECDREVTVRGSHKEISV